MLFERIEKSDERGLFSWFSRGNKRMQAAGPSIEYLEHEQATWFFVGISGSDLSNGKMVSNEEATARNDFSRRGRRN